MVCPTITFCKSLQGWVHCYSNLFHSHASVFVLFFTKMLVQPFQPYFQFFTFWLSLRDCIALVLVYTYLTFSTLFSSSRVQCCHHSCKQTDYFVNLQQPVRLQLGELLLPTEDYRSQAEGAVWPSGMNSSLALHTK